MNKIIWKEPPPAATAGRREMQEIISELKAHAGQWGVVAHRKAANAHYTFRKHGCESVSRPAEGGGFDVYARWPEAVIATGKTGDPGLDSYLGKRQARGIPSTGKAA